MRLGNSAGEAELADQASTRSERAVAISLVSSPAASQSRSCATVPAAA